MTGNIEEHHRRSIRLQGYDYGAGGAYFVTLCTQDDRRLFGTLCTDQGAAGAPVGANHHSPRLSEQPAVTVALNDAGQAVHDCWLQIPDHFPYVELDAFVIMPNHVHGILVIQNGRDLPLRANGANDDSPLRRGGAQDLGGQGSAGRAFNGPRGTSNTLGSVIRGFKTGVTVWFREHRPEIGHVWQRGYYEHVIRNEQDLNVIRDYIATNPARALVRRQAGAP